MMTKTSTADMTHEEWLEERRKSIGGSDMGAILGINPYRSPYEVWADKCGMIPPKPDNEAMRQGRDLEEYVASRFEELSGMKVRRYNAILRNDDFPHLHADIDRRVEGRSEGVECKTCSALSEKRFRGEDFPPEYYAQIVTYLAVTGWERWYLAVLALGRGFKVYQITTVPDDAKPEWCASSLYVSPDEFTALRSAAINFWDHVERKEPPEVDGSESTIDTISTIYADSDGGTMPLASVRTVLASLIEVRGSIDALTDEKNALEAKIKAYMETAEKAEDEQYRITWKTQERATLDKDKLAQDYPDINFDNYKKITKSRPFKITVLAPTEGV